MIKPQHQNFSSIIFILVIMIFFFGLTQTVTSGFHFTDDHEILRITQDLAEKPFVDVAQQWISRDLSSTGRFRPLYYLHRVLECFVFADNFLLWSLYTVGLAFLTFVLLYLGMHHLQFSALESLLFLVLVFCGAQMAIWWRLGPNETIGMFFLSISFFLATKPSKRFVLNNIFFSLSLILASWCKESFTLVVPAFVVFKIWRDTQIQQTTLLEAIKKNAILAAPFCVMLFNLFVIVFFVGTTKIIYAGVEPSVLTTLKGSLNVLKGDLRRYITLVLIVLGLIYWTIKSEKEFFRFLKPALWPCVFCLLIVVPNVILHAKDGMWERYLLPTTFGMAFLIVFCLRQTKAPFHWLYSLLLAIILGLSLPYARSMYSDARQFAFQGQQTHRLLTDILQNTTKDSRFLLVCEPAESFEWSFSLEAFLFKHQRTLNALAVKRENYDGFWYPDGARLTRSWEKEFSGKQLSDMKKPPDMVIFLDSGLIKEVEKRKVFDLSQYHNLYEPSFRFALFVKIKNDVQ